MKSLGYQQKIEYNDKIDKLVKANNENNEIRVRLTTALKVIEKNL